MITYDGKNAQTDEVGKTLKGYKISTTKWAEKEANKDPETKQRTTLTGKKFLGKKWK